jgi:hypothetical protein
MPRKSSSPSRKIINKSSEKLQINLPNTTLHSQNSQTIKLEQPGFFSNMWQGFGLGTGQAIAHNIFRSNPTGTCINTNNTNNKLNNYDKCMKETNDNEVCKKFLE